MPKRPDRAQVRLDAFLSPRGGVASTSGKSIPPRGSSMGTSSRVVGHFHQTGNHRASDGSAFVNCPVCDTRVALRLMNEHMDGPACGTAGETRCDEPRQVTEEPVHGGETPAGEMDARRKDSPEVEEGGKTEEADDDKPSALTELMRASAVEPTRLPGHHLIPDFITPDEEAALIDFLDTGEADTNPWKPSNFNGRHRGKAWGVKVDLKRRTVSPASRPLPHLVQAVADKMSATQHQALRQFEPNEANAICYDKAAGCELLPHVDDRQMSTDLIVNLSLLCDCVMTYVEDAGRDGRSGWEGAERAKKVDVFLPRRSLQVQSGPTRYNFAHSIRNENLRGPRRVSITFRRSRTPTTRTRVRGE